LSAVFRPSLLSKRLSQHCLRQSRALLILTGDIREVAGSYRHSDEREMQRQADITTLQVVTDNAATGAAKRPISAS
jgi:hypothetical protein